MDERIVSTYFPNMNLYPVPVVKNTTESVQKEEIKMNTFVKIEDFDEAVEEIKENMISRREDRIGIRLRWNRPIEWRYKWNGEKKWAKLGKPELQYYHVPSTSWYPVDEYEGSPNYIRLPRE